MTKIITDSASDITLEEAKELDIILIPMMIDFEGVAYKDKYELSVEEFYNKLANVKELPKTSQINPYTFQEVFEQIDEKDDAIVILMSSELSGTYQNAKNAAEDYDNIYVVDSRNATVGERCLIDLARQKIEEGMPAKEIAELLEKKREDVCLLALLDTLEYLKKGGRISAAAAFAGGVLSIKPVVAVEDGKVVVIGKARGSKNGNNMLVEHIGKKGGVDYEMPIVLGYSGTDRKLLDQYVEDSKALWEGKLDSMPIVNVGSTIGTHVGPGAIAVAFFRNTK